MQDSCFSVKCCIDLLGPPPFAVVTGVSLLVLTSGVQSLATCLPEEPRGHLRSSRASDE